MLKSPFLVFALALLCISCTDNAYHITSSAQVDADFEARLKEFPDSAIYNKVYSGNYTRDEVEALKFLFAYMPTPDVALYEAPFFDANLHTTMRAMEEMPWGKSVPQREFLHFVLPFRVNNENLDECRPVFYEELRDRVRGLSMADAILEVNHWCHEKVTYQPSDGRTSSPLSSVSQAIGRCGEESTFAVAALRSVGIPARQVYTPRWAHTDDNHAWVEAWADGKWHFIGACEPEAELDLAWFNEPAARGLMMTTNVIGAYDGPEEVLSQKPGITTINVTANYAPVDTLKVVVTDAEGQPVADAQVRFCIYNYSDIFPVTTRLSDAEGRASLLAGLGDMVVWATDGSKYGFAAGHPDAQPVSVVLNHSAGERSSFDLDIVPPAAGGSRPAVDESKRELNNRRFSCEDSIRSAYTATFFDEQRAGGFADSLGLDSVKIVRILTQARGNGARLAMFISQANTSLDAVEMNRLLTLLNVVSEKDRRDISTEVLLDNVFDDVDPDDVFAAQYILSPRVENEHLSPYKNYFRKEISKDLQYRIRENPQTLVNFIADNIALDTFNPQRLTMRPVDAYKWKTADARSRAILFVAMARSFGVPARVDTMTGKLQYADSSLQWIDVDFDTKGSFVAPTGKLLIDYTPAGRLENPKYYSQFSLLSIRDGVTSQLDFDETDCLKELQNKGVMPETGDYLLFSSQRQADGSLLVHGEIFPVDESETVTVPLTFRHDENAVSVIGSLNAENLWMPCGEGAVAQSILSQTGRGYYILGLIRPGDEPSNHALRDIAALKDDFDNAGVPMLLLFADASEAARFDLKAFPSMPEKAAFGIDIDSISLDELVTSLNLPSDLRPVFVIADTFNRVVFVSQGYTIGLGKQLLKTLDSIFGNSK